LGKLALWCGQGVGLVNGIFLFLVFFIHKIMISFYFSIPLIIDNRSAAEIVKKMTSDAQERLDKLAKVKLPA
jgi:hypothetical protein